MTTPSSIFSNADPMTLLRDAVAGRRVLTRAEQQRVAVAIGSKNPGLRAYLTVAMMDERAAHDGQPRLSADAVRAIAEDTAAYARALAEVAEGRAAAERAADDAATRPPVDLDALEVAPAPGLVAFAGAPSAAAPAWRPEDLEVADAGAGVPDATHAVPRWRNPCDVFTRTPVPLLDLSAPPRSTP